MRLLSWLAAGGVIFGAAGTAWAQAPQVAVPTTVQLPTFSVFTVQTTVSVPDGGGAYLGGINRGVDSSVRRGFGPLHNRALGSSRVASGVSVSATIIDHDEIDRAILASAAAERPAVDSTATKAAALSKAVARTGAVAALPDSVAAIRERNKAAAVERQNEIAGLFAKAQEAESAGRLVVAKVYYQMVARRDAGQLKQQAEARLAALGASTAVARK